MYRKRIITLGAAMLLGLTAIHGEVKLPQIISDGMVVQRDRPLTLWGSAAPGETVNIRVAKGPKTTVTADAAGNWHAELPALKTGKTYSIEIGDKTVGDVAVGDVLLCSGQSNMELPVNRVTDMFADEIAAYRNPSIRHFVVPKEFDFETERTDVSPTQWKSVDEDAMNFSALAYFTAKALNEKTGLPVGIINASWGGTPVESWISEKQLSSYPLALNQKHIYDDAAYRDHIKKVEGENYAHWNATMWGADPGLHGDVKWYDPQFDDSGWAEVDLISGNFTDGSNDRWSNDGLNPVNGSHWLRKEVEIPASMSGKPGVIRMGCIVDADSVYVNGTFVGTTGYQYPPRIYNIPAGVLHEGKNNVTVRLISQNGNPHFVAEKPYKIIVGNESVSLEGKWRYHLGTQMPQGPGMMFYCYIPAVLYNGMISPVIKYPVRGTVWYQGESNVSRRNEYAPLLKTMIANWREASGDAGMPFYIVELADFLHPSDKGGRAAWAEMRKVQAQVADETPDAFLIHNSDLGEWNDIHPLDKKTLGQRVADAIK
ncbi:MAG: hypothetical protein NC212_03735 [Staphylococcus sp.]|nr:hypothetical protein [Staphylococcus sp.]